MSSSEFILEENTSVLHTHPTLDKNDYQIWRSFSNTCFKASSSDARKRAVYTSTNSINFTDYTHGEKTLSPPFEDLTHPALRSLCSARTPGPGYGSAGNWPRQHCSGPRRTRTPATAVANSARRFPPPPSRRHRFAHARPSPLASPPLKAQPEPFPYPLTGGGGRRAPARRSVAFNLCTSERKGTEPA